MRFGSVCSGIEAASVAWAPLGWRCSFVSEIAPFPCAVLAARHPDVPNLGDMTKIGDDDLGRHGPLDLLVGGTPCQSFSVAGLRKGLADPRGNLALVFLGLLARARARWVVWENVPGVLSSHGGRDFGAFLGALGELGYGWAYRVLDAQYVRVDGFPRAVPQRRRRLFVVGCAGSRARASAALLESSCLRGAPPPRREAGARVAASLTRGADSRGGKGGYAGRRSEDDDNVVGGIPHGSSHGGGCRVGPDEAAAGHLVATAYPDPAYAVTGGPTGGQFGTGRDAQDTWVVQTYSVVPEGGQGADLRVAEVDVAPALAAKNEGVPGYDRGTRIVQGLGVRRLTPRECERLQGFPDDYTLIPYRGGEAKDGPRYQAIGNSMAVPVMRWIGRRIALVEEVTRGA